MSEELAYADANLAEIRRLRRQLALAEAEIAEARSVLDALDTETLVEAARELAREEKTSTGAYFHIHALYWKETLPKLALAEAEIATLRAAHAAVLAWLDARGALLPLAMRQELREALNL